MNLTMRLAKRLKSELVGQKFEAPLGRQQRRFKGEGGGAVHSRHHDGGAYSRAKFIL